ncbi:PE family protein [Mycobacterium basiliense]|uniref:PE family protein n=1 Tax=Mycobacterium basiliense TaxID=2094119 RepID=A0A447GGF0_9MYCO|nr:PE family protein [Mycobacterium basiliense]VDM89587.1 PE family protein [Mycobacterium basiliense]
MSYVVAAPHVLAATAGDLAAIGSTMQSANAAAAVPTAAVLPAGGDNVSMLIAALFGAHAQAYQALSARAELFHDRFVQALQAGAGSYANAEAANASPLETVLGAVGMSSENRAGGSPIGNGVLGGGKNGGAGGLGGIGQTVANGWNADAVGSGVLGGPHDAGQLGGNAGPVGPGGAGPTGPGGGGSAQHLTQSNAVGATDNGAALGAGVQHGGVGASAGDTAPTQHSSASGGVVTDNGGGSDGVGVGVGVAGDAGTGGLAGPGDAGAAGATSWWGGHGPVVAASHGGPGMGYGTTPWVGAPWAGGAIADSGVSGGLGEVGTPAAPAAVSAAASVPATQAPALHPANPLHPSNSAQHGDPGRRVEAQRDAPTLFLPLTSLRGLRQKLKKRSGLRAQSGRLRDSADNESRRPWGRDELLSALGLRPPGHE